MPEPMSLQTLQVTLHPFLVGATFALSMVAALLFLRFHRKTSDRLFLFFSAAMVLLGIDRVAFLFGNFSGSFQIIFYLMRLLAFALIILAIVDKNRRRARP